MRHFGLVPSCYLRLFPGLCSFTGHSFIRRNSKWTSIFSMHTNKVLDNSYIWIWCCHCSWQSTSGPQNILMVPAVPWSPLHCSCYLKSSPYSPTSVCQYSMKPRLHPRDLIYLWVKQHLPYKYGFLQAQRHYRTCPVAPGFYSTGDFSLGKVIAIVCLFSGSWTAGTGQLLFSPHKHTGYCLSWQLKVIIFSLSDWKWILHKVTLFLFHSYLAAINCYGFLKQI